jgi:hypothetical protein
MASAIGEPSNSNQRCATASRLRLRIGESLMLASVSGSLCKSPLKSFLHVGGPIRGAIRLRFLHSLSQRLQRSGFPGNYIFFRQAKPTPDIEEHARH